MAQIYYSFNSFKGYQVVFFLLFSNLVSNVVLGAIMDKVYD